jgi:endonuclease YncB( thermonuclease family)
MMFSTIPFNANRPRGIAWAAAAFLAGIIIGNLVSPELIGRQVMANTAPSPPAVTPAPQTMPGSHPAEVLRVLDGDTFEARVRVWPGLDITTKIRLRGIDAPELKARCAEERIKAENARAALIAILGDGGVAVGHVGLDKYGGRVLADAATRSTPDIGAAMLAKGLARPYGGGRRESWCNGSEDRHIGAPNARAN